MITCGRSARLSLDIAEFDRTDREFQGLALCVAALPMIVAIVGVLL